MHTGGASATVRDIAKQLVAYEVITSSRDLRSPSAVCLVCEKMRVPISALTGAAGFQSLLVRALNLAEHENADFEAVRVKEDGSLEGLFCDKGNGSLLVAEFINLLITFIGDALTVRLLQEIWPDLISIGLTSAGKQSHDSRK